MGYSQYQTLNIEQAQGVAIGRFANGPINLLDKPFFKELLSLVDQLAADDAVRVVVLASANPDYFIAHFDVGLILRFPSQAPDAVDPDAPLSPFHRMCETLRTMPKPTIAVVEGRAGGGGSEIALSCDMRFALAGKAVFNQPEVALGILPGGSGTVRLPRLIGRGRALEVVLGCDDIPADLAAEWGWVNRTLPADDLWPHVRRLAARMASFPPHAVAAAKASVLQADGAVVGDLRIEAAAFQGTLGAPETQAAMHRFLDQGGQTPQGEGRLGELVQALHVPPEANATPEREGER